jgi:hypothetical protein
MITSQHQAYMALLPLWTKVRDVVAGEEAVKSGGDRYLPRLASQEANDLYAQQSYASYLMRASYYDAASRTVQGLVGAIMRKDPSIEGVPDADIVDIMDALGINYEGAKALTMCQIEDAVTVGRYALMVDKGEDPEGRPYVVQFPAEDVVNWAEAEIDGRRTLSMVAISQTYEVPDPSDRLGLTVKEEPQLLILRLGAVPEQWEGVPGYEGFASAPGDQPIYWQEIWREQESGKGQKSTGFGERPYEIKVPTKNGGRFWDEIPCDIVNAIGGITSKTEKPPMLPLANGVLEHYRRGADLEWGRHMTAIPQAWMSGFDIEEGARMVVGCGYAWATPQTGANVQYLEFSGAGLGSLEGGQAATETKLAILGARMLEAQPNQAEAMGTVRLRQSGDRSILATIAHNVSEAMTRAIQRYLSWQYPSFDSTDQLAGVRYALATDFDSSRLDPAEMASLTQALQDGSISWETYSYNLRRGEMLQPGVTDEEERDRIRKGALIAKPDTIATMLQADVAMSRISTATYLEQVQKLGMYEGVDLAAEPDKVYEQKVVSAELQMLAFSQAGNNIAGDSMPTSGDGGQFGAGVPIDDEPQDEAEEPAEEDPEEDPVDPDADTEDEEDAAQ